MCNILKTSGFNPKWTYKDTHNIYKTQKGQKILKTIDKKIKAATGVKSITRDDINKCYPHFYETKKNVKLAASCHWPSLIDELNNNISGIDNSIKRQHLQNRIELEIRNLINIFQNKSKRAWEKFYNNTSKLEPDGFHIKGTDYKIPWKLLHKYNICFGMK